MAQIGSRRPFFMGQLNLAVAGTAYNIVALINAAIQAEGSSAVNQIIAGSSRLFYVEAHPGIDGAGGNTNDVLLGEAVGTTPNLLTSSRFGRVLAKTGGGFTFQSMHDNVDHLNYWVQSAGTNQKVNVIVSNG